MSSHPPSLERRLDHLVHLSPPGTLPDTVAALAQLFIILPGGTHADGLTSNALIPLASGTYVELITFNVDPPPRGHEWAPSPNGPMDFALFGTTTKDQRHAVEIVAEAGGDGQLAYREAVVGGRVRPDGKKLEWEVTLPGVAQGRGGLPFFCGDITPRDWRVPSLPAPHPSKALGVTSITILVSEKRFPSLVRFFEALLGDSIQTSSTVAEFLLQEFSPSKERPLIPNLILRIPVTDKEVARVGERDFRHYEWAFATEREGGKEGVVESALGRFVFARV